MLDNGAIGGEEPLGVAWGLKSLHAPFPLTSGLMGILDTIIEIPMLAMFHAWENLALCSTIALELIGHDHGWDVH